MKISPVVLIALCISCTKTEVIPLAATYELTFDATWSSSTHPSDFPTNPHFSGLIGLTHTADTALFYAGSLASPGIKLMAETGSKVNLETEIQAIIAKGKGLTKISGGGISLSPGMVAHEFETSTSFPVISVTLMIAPSPDWFVSAHDISLYKNGKWVQDSTLNVISYDAGTDSGSTFTSADQVTSPKENIHLIATPPLAVGGIVSAMGTIRFRRIK